MKHAYLVRIEAGLFQDTVVSLTNSPRTAMEEGLRYYQWAARQPYAYPTIRVEHIMCLDGRLPKKMA